MLKSVNATIIDNSLGQISLGVHNKGAHKVWNLVWDKFHIQLLSSNRSSIWREIRHEIRNNTLYA